LQGKKKFGFGFLVGDIISRVGLSLFGQGY